MDKETYKKIRDVYQKVRWAESDIETGTKVLERLKTNASDQERIKFEFITYSFIIDIDLENQSALTALIEFLEKFISDKKIQLEYAKREFKAL